MPFKIHVLEHKATGLLAAMCDDLPGFVVHAHDLEELEARIGPALESFLKAIGNPVGHLEVARAAPPGFWPPTFIAKAAMVRETA
jgi:hypothetical protein